MRRFSLGVALALTLAAPALAKSGDPTPVIQAELAFAADGKALGVRDSFLKHSAPEGIVFAPEPILAKAAFQAPASNQPALVWWPLWAGISRSGDLGFTTGPYTLNGERRGYYFTVWAKQPDGSWKWLFDGGPPSEAAAAPGEGAPVAHARPAERQAGSAGKAMREVTAVEAALHAKARIDAKAAFLAAVAEDGRIVGSRLAPPANRAELERELDTRAPTILFSRLGGTASNAGDLAWTYGAAQWTKDGASQRGHYVRVWRNDRSGWRLLFDELLPVPPRRTAAS